MPSIVTSIRGFAAVLSTTICLGAHAQAVAPIIKVVTLCAAGEKTIMAGRMQRVKKDAKGITYVPNGKFASLCANSSDEPISAMVYRYGKPGAIEMEEVASPQRKFFVFYDSIGPKAGSDTVWFSKGDYRYQISAGTGMGRGVALTVHKGGKQVVDLFSGLEDEDHFSATEGISFDAPKSPVLSLKTPF